MKPLALAAVIAAALSTARPAAAQTAQEKARATALLKDGASLLENKRHADALERFKAAFAIVPSPKIQFNIALANEGLERYAQAWEAFQSYLDGATNDASSRRADAKKRQDALRARVAFVQVTSDTNGAAISLDGAEVARTPQQRPLVVDPGAHQILVAEGTRTWTRSFRADAGASVTLDAALTQPAPAVAPSLPEASAREPQPPVGEVVATAAPGDPDPTPVYKKVWFWGVVGTIAAAGVVTAVLLSSSTTIDRRCGVAGIECETWK